MLHNPLLSVAGPLHPTNDVVVNPLSSRAADENTRVAVGHIIKDVLADIVGEGDSQVGTSLLIVIEILNDQDLKALLAGDLDNVATRKGQMSVTNMQTLGGWDQVTYTNCSVASEIPCSIVISAMSSWRGTAPSRPRVRPSA